MSILETRKNLSTANDIRLTRFGLYWHILVDREKLRQDFKSLNDAINFLYAKKDQDFAVLNKTYEDLRQQHFELEVKLNEINSFKGSK